MEYRAIEQLECATCGYSLRNLPVDAACPECGGTVRTVHARFEHRTLAGTAVALAVIGPFIAFAPEFLALTNNDSIEFGAPAVGAALELVAIVLAVVSRRWSSPNGVPGRTLSRTALWIAVPLLLLLGCCGGISIGFLHGYFTV